MIQLIKYWWLTVKFVYSNLFKKKTIKEEKGDSLKYVWSGKDGMIYSSRTDMDNEVYVDQTCASTINYIEDSCATEIYPYDYGGNEIVRKLPKEKPPTL